MPFKKLAESLGSPNTSGSGRLRSSRGRSSLLFLGALSVLQVILFSPSFAYFFQGDSLYWICHRYQDLRGFLQAFVGLDSYGWFRPLAHATIPSVFFPFFGPNAGGYHWIVFLIFLGTTWVYFLFLKRLTADWLMASLGTFYFGTHSINVFISYDFAFEPDLFFGFFAVSSALFFVRFLDTGVRGYWIGSTVLFVFSLLSKEVAVCLVPVLMFLAWSRTTAGGEAPPHKAPCRLAWWKASWPFLGIAIFYLLYTATFVGGGRWRSGGVGSSYMLAPGSGTLTNLGRSVLWAVDIPNGWHMQWRHLPGLLILILAGWLLVVVVYCAAVLVKRGSARWCVLLGLGWFGIVLFPAALLQDFKPYYLYVPMMGFSLVAAGAVAWLGRKASSLSWLLSVATVLSFMTVFLVANQKAIQADRLSHPLLGPASTLIWQHLQDVQSAYPDLNSDALLLILDKPEDQLWWHHAGGKLFNLAYQDESLRTAYRSFGGLAVEETASLVVFEVDSGHLVEVTEQFREDPRPFQEVGSYDYRNSANGVCRLEVSTQLVVAGRDSYTLRFPDFPGQVLAVQFRRNGGEPSHFRVRLNSAGEVSFFVSADTPRGRYEFLAVRPEQDDGWLKCSATSIVVE